MCKEKRSPFKWYGYELVLAHLLSKSASAIFQANDNMEDTINISTKITVYYTTTELMFSQIDFYHFVPCSRCQNIFNLPIKTLLLPDNAPAHQEAGSLISDDHYIKVLVCVLEALK